MLDPKTFAREWIEAWNAHDVERILSHYAPEIVYQSAFVAKLGNAPDGILQGSDALRAYVQRGLEAFPDLHFVLLEVFSGVDSVVLRYRSVNNLIAAEFFQFKADGKIARVVAHYSS